MTTTMEVSATINLDDMKKLDEKPIFTEEWDSMANLVSEEELSMNDGSAESHQHQNENHEENDEVLFFLDEDLDDDKEFSTQEINSVLEQWKSDKYDQTTVAATKAAVNKDTSSDMEVLVESNARSGDHMSLPEFVMISEGVKELPPLKLDEGKLTNFDWTTYRGASLNLAKLMKKSDKTRKSLTMKPKLAAVKKSSEYKSVNNGIAGVLKSRKESRKQLQKLLDNINRQQKKRKTKTTPKATTPKKTTIATAVPPAAAATKTPTKTVLPSAGKLIPAPGPSASNSAATTVVRKAST